MCKHTHTHTHTHTHCWLHVRCHLKHWRMCGTTCTTCSLPTHMLQDSTPSRDEWYDVNQKSWYVYQQLHLEDQESLWIIDFDQHENQWGKDGVNILWENYHIRLACWEPPLNHSLHKLEFGIIQ